MLPVLVGPQVSWLLSQQCALQFRRDELTMQQSWRSNPSREGSLSVSCSLRQWARASF